MGGGTAIGAAAGIAAAAAALLFSQWQRTGRRSRAARQLNHKLQEGYVLTLEELGAYDGLDPNKPTLLAIRGQIFDVSSRPDMYGPEGTYPFAGKEIARALAKMSVKPEDQNGDLVGLTEEEMGILRDWEEKFNQKYEVVGNLRT